MARWAANVKTTLRRLGVDTSARLLRHAYALAAMNLHVFLGLPFVMSRRSSTSRRCVSSRPTRASHPASARVVDEHLCDGYQRGSGRAISSIAGT